jgi:hypothetical protein
MRRTWDQTSAKGIYDLFLEDTYSDHVSVQAYELLILNSGWPLSYRRHFERNGIGRGHRYFA